MASPLRRKLRKILGTRAIDKRLRHLEAAVAAASALHLPEDRTHHAPPPPPEPQVDPKAAASHRFAVEAAARMNRPIRVVDVGAQSLGEPTHPYYPLKSYAKLEIVGFDPLKDRLDERRATEQDDGLTLLPYAIGDGRRHTLYVNNNDATSSLFPLDLEHNAPYPNLRAHKTVRTEELDTHRLDDVLDEAPIDFLKLDTQGSELMILQHAARALERTAVIHAEVEFSPIYKGQPLYPEIQAHLDAAGFYLVDLLTMARYSHKPRGQGSTDVLVWADAVFFRKAPDADARLSQALIAAAVYQKPSFAEHLLGLGDPVPV